MTTINVTGSSNDTNLVLNSNSASITDSVAAFSTVAQVVAANGVEALYWAPEPNVAHTTDEWKIWAYTQGAPEHIGKYAAVIAFDNSNPTAAPTTIRAALPVPGVPGVSPWFAFSAKESLMETLPNNSFSSALASVPTVGDGNCLIWLAAARLAKSKTGAYKAAEAVLVGSGDIFGTMLDPNLPALGSGMSTDGWMYMALGDIGEPNTIAHMMAEPPVLDIQNGPHHMLVPKDPATINLQTTNYNTGEAYLMMAGGAGGHLTNGQMSHLMIPLDHFYMYQAQGSKTTGIRQGDK